MIVAMIGCVDRCLFGANIVRPDWGAEAFRAFGNEAATGEEIYKSWQVGIQDWNSEFKEANLKAKTQAFTNRIFAAGWGGRVQGEVELGGELLAWRVGVGVRIMQEPELRAPIASSSRNR